MQDLIRLVEFDIRGENKVNYFTKEEIELQDKTCNFIIPNASPFFGEPENFKLYNAKGGELKIGKDYSLVGEFIPFCDVSGRSVVTFIELSDEVLKNNDKVFATYISIGAYFIPRGELEKWKDTLHTGKIPIDFEEKVHSIPEVLPPSHHLHNVREEITNWYDLTYFFHNLYGLVKGKDRNILTTIDREIDKAFELMKTYRVNEQTKLTKHDKDYNNPHGTSAKDIDLGNVPNIGVATPEEIVSGKGDNKFLTTDSVDLITENGVEVETNTMLPGVYPVSKFGGDSYIPPSISGSFEGLGHENFTIACLEENHGLTFLAPRFDGKSRGLYYFNVEKGLVLPTYHKYDHPFFRTNNVVPSHIYNNSGKDVMMIYDRAGSRFAIASIGGTLNPEGHTWSFLNITGIAAYTATTTRMGRWVYVFQALGKRGAGSEGYVSWRIHRFLFEKIGKEQVITPELVSDLTYTNADGERRTQVPYLDVFKNIPATETTSKQCFYKFTGVLPRNVNMNAYTSGVLKKELGGGKYQLRFLSSYWIESIVSSTAGTIEVVFDYDPERPNQFEFKGNSPKFNVVDGGWLSLPPHSPSAGWMHYGGGNQTFWFDEETNTVRMGYSRSTSVKQAKLDDFFNNWFALNTSSRQITSYGVSLTNPLGIKPTLGSCVWGNGVVSFVSLRDTNSAQIINAFSYKEGFKIRPEVFNEFVKDLYSLPLPSKIKPLVLKNVPFRLFSNIAPLNEHTTNNKGVPSFGKLFSSSNYMVLGTPTDLKVPSKTVVTETEDNITIEGVSDRTYTKATIEFFLSKLKGVKSNWKEYPQVILSVYEADGEIAEGKGEVAKTPFIVNIDAYDGVDGYSAVILFNINKSKMTVNPSDITVVKEFDYKVTHGKAQPGGVSDLFRERQPIYIKVSKEEGGTYLIMLPTTQYRVTAGNSGLDGVVIKCTGANTTSPQWSTSNIGFWGATAIFHADLGIGFSPSESMVLESLRTRNITGGCSVMIGNFMFASTYPQEGWVIYFPSEQDVLINGSSYKLPVGSIDLRDAIPDPKDKTIYIYATVEGNKPFYYASLVEGPRSVYHLLVAVVKTSKTKIESIDRLQPVHVGDRMISKFREGAILPISTGFPQDDGWFDHLDGEDLGIAKPGPDMPVPTGPVTQFDWRQEHGNVGEYSWTNPTMDYSVENYVKAGYFEADVQHYLKQGYDLSKYRLVISEWFTYVGQSGDPENKTTHALMPFVHDDIKKRFKTGYVKPRTDYVSSKYLHIADTYLPTRIERKDKSDLGIVVPHKINDSAIKSKVSNYETLTGIGPIASNFGEYFDVESKSLKPTDWWTSGVDFDFNRMIIDLLPFNSGGDGLNRENEFTQAYMPLRTKLEKENKYLHEFYFKPKIPFQTPNANKTVGMFATSKTERYIDKPAPAPSGKALPSIIVKPGNGLLSRGVSKGDLEKNIRGSWWEPILNNSVTDDRKFYDGRGYNPNTHDLHYYIWEDVTWNGSNTRDMYNHINTRGGKDRIRVDVNHFRQAQRYFATIVSLPKGHKFDGSRMQITMVNTPEVSVTEANQLISRLGFGTVDSGFGNLFLNPINQVKHKDWYDGSVNWNATILQLGVWPIVTRNGGGTLQEQRAKAYNSDYLPRRNELVRTNESVFEHWFETETTWKGKTIGGILITGKLLTVAPASSDNALINVRVIPGNFGSYRTLDGWNERTYVRLDNNPRKLEELMQGWINEFNRGGMLTDAQYAEILEVNRLNGEFALLGISRTAYYEFKKAGYTKDSHVLELTPWSEPSAELDHGGRDPRGKRDMHRLATMRGYQRVTVPEWITRAFPAPINANGTFYGYKLVPRYEQLNSDIPFEIQNGDVGTLAQVNQLIAACGLGDFKNAWGRFFLRTSRQLKPVDWYSGGVNWAHNKLVFKVWQLNDITAHPGNIRQNAINRNSGFYNLYVPKRDRLIRDHKYVFEHWFPDDLTMNGKVVSGIFITAHVERTAEPPQIFRYQFWYGSRYHKGHVDSCINKYVVSERGFDGYPQCRVSVHPPGVDLPPSRSVMAGLIEIPDNCHLVSSNITSGGYVHQRVIGGGKKTVEFQQIHPSRSPYLRIVIGNEIGERKEFVFRVG